MQNQGLHFKYTYTEIVLYARIMHGIQNLKEALSSDLNHRAGSLKVWVPFPSLPLSHCVTLDKLLYLSLLQLPIPKMRITTITSKRYCVQPNSDLYSGNLLMS